METNKLVHKLDPNVIFSKLESDITSANAYTVLAVIDTSRHPSFAVQIINKHATYEIDWKVETTFDGAVLTEISAEAELIQASSVIFEDISVGTKVIISFKSATESEHANCNVWVRLNPGTYIV